MFVQFVTKCDVADIQGKCKDSGRKRVDFMNMHCWEGLEMIDKSMLVCDFVLFDEA